MSFFPKADYCSQRDVLSIGGWYFISFIFRLIEEKTTSLMNNVLRDLLHKKSFMLFFAKRCFWSFFFINWRSKFVQSKEAVFLTRVSSQQTFWHFSAVKNTGVYNQMNTGWIPFTVNASVYTFIYWLCLMGHWCWGDPSLMQWTTPLLFILIRMSCCSLQLTCKYCMWFMSVYKMSLILKG